MILKTSNLLASLLLISTIGSAQAHDAWLRASVDRGEAFAVVYGHAGKEEGYAAAKVKAVVAQDAKGQALKVERKDGADSVALSFSAKPAVAAVEYDNGYWSKAPGGKTLNVPKTENPGATSGSHNAKFHKSLFTWNAATVKPLQQEAEIVPLQSSQPKAGDVLKVQVLYKGKPAAGWKIGFDDAENSTEMTDGNGRAQITVKAGRNFLSTGHRIEVKGNPRFDVYGIAANLVFESK